MASPDSRRSVYDVFARFQRTERPVHIGSVTASDRDDAEVLSRYVFDERRWLEMIVVSRADIAPLPVSREAVPGRLLLLGRPSALESLTVLATIAGADGGEPRDESLDEYRSEWVDLALVPAERAAWVRTRRSAQGA